MPSTPDPHPISLIAHQHSRTLEVAFDDGAVFRIPFELLRVHSPSAEVQGHGPGQEVLQTGKRDVTVTKIEQVGHYAIQPTFSDGHSSGIYTWAYLYELGAQEHELWTRYKDRLAVAGLDRDAPMASGTGKACGH